MDIKEIKKEFYKIFNEASEPEYMWHWIEEKLKQKEEFEYLIVGTNGINITDREYDNQLQEYGKKGWELCSIDKDGIRIFKRQKVDAKGVKE